MLASTKLNKKIKAARQALWEKEDFYKGRTESWAVAERRYKQQKQEERARELQRKQSQRELKDAILGTGTMGSLLAAVAEAHEIFPSERKRKMYFIAFEAHIKPILFDRFRCVKLHL